MEGLPSPVDELSIAALFCVEDVFSAFPIDYVGSQQPVPGTNENVAVTEDAAVHHSSTSSAQNVVHFPHSTEATDTTSSEGHGATAPPTDERTQSGARKRKRKAGKSKINLKPCQECSKDQKKCTPLREDPTSCERCRAKALTCRSHIPRKKSRGESASEPTYTSLHNSPHFGVINLRPAPAERQD